MNENNRFPRANAWSVELPALGYLELGGLAALAGRRLEAVGDLVERLAGGLGQHERAEQRGDEATDRAHGPHGQDAERGHQPRVHLDGGEHELVTARVEHAVHGALDVHGEHLAAHAPRQREHGEHGEEHVEQERHDEQIAGGRVGRAAERVRVRDHHGHGRAHAQTGDDGQQALGRGLEHHAGHGAGEPGAAQVHGRGHAVDGHAAVAHHVHRVEQQHVEAGALLADEERERGGRGLPHGRRRVLGPAAHVLAASQYRAHRRVAAGQRRDGRGRARRRRQRRHVLVTRQLEPEPPFRFARVLVAAARPQPHRRRGHQERRAHARGARHADHRGHRAPVQHHAQRRGRHLAQAHEQREDQQVERPAARRARLGYVHVDHASGTCAIRTDSVSQ